MNIEVEEPPKCIKCGVTCKLENVYWTCPKCGAIRIYKRKEKED